MSQWNVEIPDKKPYGFVERGGLVWTGDGIFVRAMFLKYQLFGCRFEIPKATLWEKKSDPFQDPAWRGEAAASAAEGRSSAGPPMLGEREEEKHGSGCLWACGAHAVNILWRLCLTIYRTREVEYDDVQWWQWNMTDCVVLMLNFHTPGNSGCILTYGDFLKYRGTPKSSNFVGIFNYKPSILEYPYL